MVVKWGLTFTIIDRALDKKALKILEIHEGDSSQIEKRKENLWNKNANEPSASHRKPHDRERLGQWLGGNSRSKARSHCESDSFNGTHT